MYVVDLTVCVGVCNHTASAAVGYDLSLDGQVLQYGAHAQSGNEGITGNGACTLCGTVAKEVADGESLTVKCSLVGL